MGNPKKKQAEVVDEKPDKKKTRKTAIIFSLVVIAVSAAVIFGGEFFAKESLISETPVSINGKDYLVRLSEKASSYVRKNSDNFKESGTTHYGYFLELTDHSGRVSSDKIKFKSPVSSIQNTPEIISFSNGDIWVVSTTNSSDDDRRGFILKFSVNGNKLVKKDFELDEKYTIRDIDENKVILSEGNSVYTGYNEIFGGIYLDLESGEIVNKKPL